MDTLSKTLKNFFDGEHIIGEIEATKDILKTKDELLHYLVDLKSFSKNKFSEKMFAYQLALLGVEKASIGTFKNFLSNSSAMQSSEENTIFLGNRYYDNLFKFVTLISNISHETFHICQDNIKDYRKYNIDTEERSITSNSTKIAKILGMEDLWLVFYYANIMERQAFLHEINFTENFLTEAQDLAKSENKHLSYTLIKAALSQYKKFQVKPIMRKIAKADKKFIENIPNLYSKADKNLERYISLIEKNRDGDRYSLKDVISEIKLLKDVSIQNKNYRYLRPYIAITGLLSFVPIRERVVDYLNVILSSRGVTDVLVDILLDNKVPLSQSDFAKIFVCSDYYKENGCNFLDSNCLVKLDEETICKNFLISQGPKVMKEKFFELFKDHEDLLSILDVDKINKMIDEYPKETIFLKGKSFEGTSQILYYTLDTLIDGGIIEEDDFALAKIEIADNLVNIIRHFDYPTPDNNEYLLALYNFIENPFEKQFEVEDEFSELSSMHDYHLSEKLADYIASQRQEDQECICLEK